MDRHSLALFSLVVFSISCGPNDLAVPQDSAPIQQIERECRTFPSEFIELHETGLRLHTCEFTRERSEFSCMVDDSYRYTLLYRSINDFIDEANLIGLPRYTTINYTIGSVLVLQEQLSFTDKNRFVGRIIRDPLAKRTIITETMSLWDEFERPILGEADFDYGDGDTCIGHTLAFDYDDEDRLLTKTYSGAEGSNCDTTTLMFQFDGNGNLRLQLLSWHGAEPRKIRRGDILSVDEVCR